MNSRIDLHEELRAILGSGFVYFQPPESVKMVYPCVVYALDNMDVKYADDRPYLNAKRYRVTVIDKDPDSVIPDRMLVLPYCGLTNVYTADNLNHWVFSLYF